MDGLRTIELVVILLRVLFTWEEAIALEIIVVLAGTIADNMVLVPAVGAELLNPFAGFGIIIDDTKFDMLIGRLRLFG
jgi:hypothetical protein